jgi:hypothetical protein
LLDHLTDIRPVPALELPFLNPPQVATDGVKQTRVLNKPEVFPGPLEDRRHCDTPSKHCGSLGHSIVFRSGQPITESKLLAPTVGERFQQLAIGFGHAARKAKSPNTERILERSVILTLGTPFGV